MSLDPNQIPVDCDAVVATLRRWVTCESPTWDAAAVSRMARMAADDLVAGGASVELISVADDVGNCVRARFPHPAPDQPGILILGHLDTVHPVGTLAQNPWRIEDGRCFGPGVLDMKGGNVIAMAALAGLAGIGHVTARPVTMLLTSDEEIGSPRTRELIESEARRHRYVLVPEPARRDGGVVTGRYAVSRYDIETTGQPSHAGLRPGEGTSAIREMAHQIIAIEELSQGAATFTVGVVHGGQWVNCVPTRCTAEVLSVTQTEADAVDAAALLAALRPSRTGTGVSARLRSRRPLWVQSLAGRVLYEIAATVAAQLGFAIPSQNSAGGSDGNFTGALGIATLDGLGPRGDGPHTLGEHVVIDSLPERARLIAGLLAALD